MADATETPVVAEIASLLDQCSPEELNNILKAIEGGGSDDSILQQLEKELPPPQEQAAPISTMPPVAPACPPPVSGSRRPNPVGARPRSAPANEVKTRAPLNAVSAPPPQPMPATVATQDNNNQVVTMEALQAMLSTHSEAILQEVRKILPSNREPLPTTSDIIDSATLTKALAERDEEVRALEAHLGELQQVLVQKEMRVNELNMDLENVMRDVRHRQLDLEFQQLKLEERVRSNAELEQAQRKLTAQVEEVSWNARHAARDVDMCRTTPRDMRVQGSLPWALRKNR